MDYAARLTIREIAKEAGVSTQTVSRVINDRPDVAAKTRLRVQEIIDRTGYYPSPHAQGLTLSQNKIIGVITSGTSEYGPAQNLAGIDREADKHGYSLALTILHSEHDVMPAIRKMRAQNVAGLIWSVDGLSGASFDQIAKILKELPFPTVLNAAAFHKSLKTIEIDNLWGGQLAVKYLLEQGYQTIGVIAGPLNERVSRERLMGWRETLENENAIVDESLIAYGDWSPQSGYEAVQTLFAQHPDLDAVFSCNDEMAIGAMRAINEMGRLIPGEVGVIGFDNIPLAAFTSPPLTTVRQDLALSSQIAVRELISMIEQERDNPADQENVITILPELIVRGSALRR